MTEIAIRMQHCEVCGGPRGVFGSGEHGGYCERCENTVATHVLLVEVTEPTKGTAVPYRTGKIFAVRREAFEATFPDRKGTQWCLVGEAELKKVVPGDILDAPSAEV
jgi:hypothetical protein